MKRSGIATGTAALCTGLTVWALPLHGFQSPSVSCRFAFECYDMEACTEADFALEVRPDPDAQGRFVMSDISETVPALAVRDGGGLSFVGYGNGAVRLLSGQESGEARLSVHTETGDVMINYAGVCEHND